MFENEPTKYQRGIEVLRAALAVPELLGLHARLLRDLMQAWKE